MRSRTANMWPKEKCSHPRENLDFAYFSMRASKAFHWRMPPKIKTNTRKAGLAICVAINHHSARKPIQETRGYAQPKAVCSHQLPLPPANIHLARYLISPTPSWLQAISPFTPDIQHVSSPSRWQASLLLEWINKSSSSILGCIQRPNDQS